MPDLPAKTGARKARVMAKVKCIARTCVVVVCVRVGVYVWWSEKADTAKECEIREA